MLIPVITITKKEKNCIVSVILSRPTKKIMFLTNGSSNENLQQYATLLKKIQIKI